VLKQSITSSILNNFRTQKFLLQRLRNLQDQVLGANLLAGLFRIRHLCTLLLCKSILNALVISNRDSIRRKRVEHCSLFLVIYTVARDIHKIMLIFSCKSDLQIRCADML
jgi:hypothetical protein